MWKFLYSATNRTNWINNPNKEICLIGRSNVGKSSLINALAKSKIAKTSKTPGKTKLINFFAIDQQQIIVDLPGYGYAKLSKGKVIAVNQMIEEYFNHRTSLKLVLCLVDAKVGPTKLDYQVFDYLNSINKNYLIVLTKSDKLNQSQRSQILKKMAQLKLKFIITSSFKGGNILKLNKLLQHFYQKSKIKR